MSAAKLIACIAVGVAVGSVLGQILWEFLLAGAVWAGGAVVRAVASMMRTVSE
jgi:hypothetical protein